MIPCRIARPFAGLRGLRFMSTSFQQHPPRQPRRYLSQFSDSQFQSQPPPPPPQPADSSSSAPSSPSQPSSPGQRQEHSVPRLTHAATWAEHGIDGFLSPRAFQWAWTEYQQMLVDELNKMTKEKTGLHSYSASELIAICARDPAHARLFNYASMAFNNHTFFLNLTNQTQQVPDPMLEAIEESCSSLDSLKAEFIAIANAMFGPGFVWLVKENEFGRLRLLSTYLAGSPLSEAHVRSSSPYLSSWESHGSRTSMNSLASPGGGSAANRSTRVSSSYDNLQSSTQQQRQKRLAPNGIEITPLLCVNLWEHVWVPDYGVFGKRDYLEAWWNKIDWSSVMTQAAQHGASTPRISSMGF